MTRSTNYLLRGLLLLVAGGVLVATVATVSLGPGRGDPTEQTVDYSIHAIGPQFSLDELDADSDLVLLGVAGEQQAAWNSADNKPWVPADGMPGDPPLIYTDTQFTVIRVVRGSYDSEAIEVRTVGGVVGDARMTVGAAPAIQSGMTYLLLLEYIRAPLHEGFEYAWAPVSLGQGIFVVDGSTQVYRNSLGETASERDLED